MVVDMEVDMVVDKVTVIDMEIQFGERVRHGGWLIGPKIVRPEAYPACAASKSFASLLNNNLNIAISGFIQINFGKKKLPNCLHGFLVVFSLFLH